MFRGLINKVSSIFSSEKEVLAYEVQSNSTISKDSHIGDYTYIGFNCFVSKSQIGRYCSIANNVSIGLGEHDTNKISTSSLFYTDPYNELTKNECIIKDDVWLGVDVIVRRGVTVGHGAVIGANSFVNSDIPPFAIAAGNPAKIIRYRFSEDTQVKILESKWWLKNKETAKKTIDELELKLVHQ